MISSYGIEPSFISVQEFFSKRADDPAWPEPSPEGRVMSKRFDDAAAGMMERAVIHENVKKPFGESEAVRPVAAADDKQEKPRAVSGWHADPPPMPRPEDFKAGHLSGDGSFRE